MQTLPDPEQEDPNEETGLVMGSKSAEDALDPDGGAAPRPVYMVGPPQRGPSQYTRTGPEYGAEKGDSGDQDVPKIQVMDAKGELSSLDAGGRPGIGENQQSSDYMLSRWIRGMCQGLMHEHRP